jgi:UDP-2-acetamido-3-amino-2,3-dideoxy-glucuronate N-acetyltransferase
MQVSSSYLDPNAVVHPSTQLGEGCKIWARSHVRENAVIGDDVVVGEGVYIGSGVRIGSRTKIQNGAQIYDPAVIEEGVFIGPGVILTNDRNPRAINSDGSKKSQDDWKAVGTYIGFGASIGAGTICISPVKIGEWAFVAAGSVVVNDVEAFALVAGVPAKRINWVGKMGYPLQRISEGYFQCPISKEEYREIGSERLELM